MVNKIRYLTELNPDLELNAKRAMEQMERVRIREREALADLIVAKLTAKATAYDGEAYV